jgi:hypothetical protein
VIVPCSRVGHLFHSESQYKRWEDNHPFSFPDGGAGPTVGRNRYRVAEVWLDEYAELAYRCITDLRLQDDLDNVRLLNGITRRKQLRKMLGCRPMRWYIQYVYPELLEADSMPMHCNPTGLFAPGRSAVAERRGS